MTRKMAGMLAGLLVVVMGCSDASTPLVRREAQLRKPLTELAADAAKRVYPAEAERGEPVNARAQIDYTLNYLRILNMGTEDITAAELWINRRFVVYLQTLPAGKFTTVEHVLIFDDKGRPYSAQAGYVQQLELHYGGKVRPLGWQLTD